jgi:hypothetical protein
MIFTSFALEKGFEAMANAKTLTSQVLHGITGNASLISISHNVSKVLNLMVFHL